MCVRLCVHVCKYDYSCKYTYMLVTGELVGPISPGNSFWTTETAADNESRELFLRLEKAKRSNGQEWMGVLVGEDPAEASCTVKSVVWACKLMTNRLLRMCVCPCLFVRVTYVRLHVSSYDKSGQFGGDQ